ncbi:hypothetical protein CLPU_1c01670 [Gottschalkia purinilytica]|uniref:Uncharacterized protein n=1 Tax=Gottschalkia purinilytica TaxID=1503 RepID=A0A0L0WEU6_GOTPU|nr:hypothetical protein [Gottschalkia purinilytica]KNF10002.1 hypothetical protein CLPU_1c01670 [Gottschalkia purinilytica]
MNSSEFVEKVNEGVKELININQIEDLDEFNAGLYITNVFDKLYKSIFGNGNESQENKIQRLKLWSLVYNDTEIKRYEKYILEEIIK